MPPRAGPAEPSYSLVLGAGGRPGLAFHAGTLLGLELHGYGPTGATSITGTSAGSLATALLASGGTVEDIAAYVVGAPPTAAFEVMEGLLRAAEQRRPRFDPYALRHLADARRALAAMSHFRAGRLLAGLATAVPGMIDMRHRLRFLDGPPVPATRPAQWRIVAADLHGGRYVFTAGEAPLSTAVAASCAIPGLFAPVRHGDRLLVDGGVHSTTNADLALEDPATTVIVVAPMCRRVRGPGTLAPDLALAAEIAELGASGRRVVTIRPSAALRRLLGRNPLAGRRLREITAAAFLEVSDALHQLGPRRRAAA